MILTLDVETTFIKTDKGSDPSPYTRGNQLVSVGFKEDDNPVQYVWFYHSKKDPTPDNMMILGSCVFLKIKFQGGMVMLYVR